MVHNIYLQTNVVLPIYIYTLVYNAADRGCIYASAAEILAPRMLQLVRTSKLLQQLAEPANMEHAIVMDIHATSSSTVLASASLAHTSDPLSIHDCEVNPYGAFDMTSTAASTDVMRMPPATACDNFAMGAMGPPLAADAATPPRHHKMMQATLLQSARMTTNNINVGRPSLYRHVDIPAQILIPCLFLFLCECIYIYAAGRVSQPQMQIC